MAAAQPSFCECGVLTILYQISSFYEINQAGRLAVTFYGMLKSHLLHYSKLGSIRIDFWVGYFMKKIFKKSIHTFSEQMNSRIFRISLLLIVLMLSSIVLYNRKINRQITCDTTRNLCSTYTQVNQTFTMFANRNWNCLSDWERYLRHLTDDETLADDWSAFFQEKQTWGFSDFFLFNEANQFTTMAGRAGDAENASAAFQMLYTQDGPVVASYTSSGGVRRVLFAVPIQPFLVGGITYTGLAVSYDNSTLEATLCPSVFNGKSDCYIVDASGNVVLSVTQKTEITDYVDNLPDYLDAHAAFPSESDASALRQALSDQEEGGFRVTYNGIDYYLIYLPTGMQDWSMVGLVQAKVVEGSFRHVQLWTAIIIFFAMACIVILVAAIIDRRSKVLLQREHQVLKDLSLEKDLSDQLLSGITRAVDRYAYCDLVKGTYEYREYKGTPLYPASGRYEDLVNGISARYSVLTEDNNAKITNMLSKEHLQSLLKTPEDTVRFEYSSRDEHVFLVMNVVPLSFANGKAAKIMLFAQDIGAQHELESIANTDALTRLFNKRYYETLLRYLRDTHKGFTLFYMDLDLFKPINDTYGHDVGDKVLKETAQRLLACIRSTDYAFRIGGDEFAVIAGDAMSESLCRQKIDKIKGLVCQPMHIGDLTLRVGISCGFAVCPADSTNPEEVCTIADRRMYEDKEASHAQR